MALVRIDEFTVENKKDGRRWRTNPDGTTSTIIPEGWKDNFVRIAKGEEHFNKWVKRLFEDKKDFTIIKNGSFWSIQSPTFDYLIKYKVKDRKNKLTGGKHLIPLVRKAVENYKGVIPEDLKEPVNIYKNPKALIEDIHYRMLDLNRAYWTAAYRLGYLTELQWLNGMDDNWKIGGNAAIGCLKRIIKEDVYINGVLVSDNQRVNRDCRYANARLHIVNHVASIMAHCCKLAGDTLWASVHTDAITLHPKANIPSITKYLIAKGFSFKFNSLLLKDI